jgi:murein DD-endopeptidase MepM/ murein hydrolase activator NlpD
MQKRPREEQRRSKRTYVSASKQYLKRTDRRGKEDIDKMPSVLIRQVTACLLIFALAVGVRQSNSPTAQKLKDSIGKSLNVSSSMEDVSVFFSGISEQFNDVKNKAVSVFTHKKDDENSDIESDAESTEDSETLPNDDQPSEDEEEQPNENENNAAVQETIPDYKFENTVYNQKIESPRIISTYFETPLSIEDTMEDYDSGEKRTETPYDKPVELGFTMVTPVKGEVTSQYGMRINPVTKKKSFHYGIDIAASKGTHIAAAYEGLIKEIGVSAAYGNYVTVAHENGFETFYGHCDTIYVTEGQRVSAGEGIATVGSSGWSTGNHLHFEIRMGNKVLSPLKYVSVS